METINNDFTQEDYDNLIIERNKLQKQQWLTGVDNSARIKEIETFLNSSAAALRSFSSAQIPILDMRAVFPEVPR